MIECIGHETKSKQDNQAKEKPNTDENGHVFYCLKSIQNIDSMSLGLLANRRYCLSVYHCFLRL
ncbi:hypothetical protein L289_2918 [Acinetobacter gerneri DSM 14967 = CIP 107464 = MTCC 9824]|nr:hypothetical protein L289_2918 [Acinetobacter gerneri DSM 14967 = CIP 107464 = MTCC 9824]